MNETYGNRVSRQVRAMSNQELLDRVTAALVSRRANVESLEFQAVRQEFISRLVSSGWVSKGPSDVPPMDITVFVDGGQLIVVKTSNIEGFHKPPPWQVRIQGRVFTFEGNLTDETGIVFGWRYTAVDGGAGGAKSVDLLDY